MKFITRKFYSFLFTSSIAMVIVFIMLLSDTVIAGQFIGDAAIAGVNLVLPIFSMTAFVAVLISVGTSVSYSYSMGKMQKEQADCFFGQGVILAAGSGAILFLLTLFGKTLYFEALSPSSQVLDCAADYYRFYPYIVLLYPLSALLSDLIYADGDELICNLSYIVQIVGNIACSVVLCKILGIRGIGLGTLTGTVLSLAVLALHFFRKGNTLRFKWHFNPGDILHVVKFGITDGEQYFCNAVMLYMINQFVIRKFGSSMLPVISVVAGIIELTIVFDGIGQALCPIISVYRGEDNSRGIRAVMRTAQRTAVVEGLLVMALLLGFADYIPALFGVTDAEIIRAAVPAIRIVSATLVLSALKYLFTSYYLLLEKLWLSVLMTFVSDCAGVLGLGIPLALLFGIHGLWIGFAAAPAAALALGLLFVRIRYGRAAVPLLLPAEKAENIFSFDLVLTGESVLKLRDDVETLLIGRGVSRQTVYRIMLMIEEVGNLILDRNAGKKVYVECTVMLNEQVRLILRDSGVIFNVTDADMGLTSWNAYIVASIMEKYRKNSNLTTMGYNKNEFRFDDPYTEKQ